MIKLIVDYDEEIGFWYFSVREDEETLGFPGITLSRKPTFSTGETVCMSHYPELFHRHALNPILTAANWPYPAHNVFNPGATLLEDCTTLLLCRVEDRRGHSHLCAARSVNGIDDWEIDAQPTFMPEPDKHIEELWGIEDARISYIPELSKYAIVYTAFTQHGPAVALAFTQDFKQFERFGVIMPPEDKDAALLPYRIDGEWVLIHRPVSGPRAHIWLSSSSDFQHWGNQKVMLEARWGSWWDANKIGMSPPLIETPKGWLMIYHGVRHTAAGSLYRLGLALFDLKHPEICLKRGSDWVFGPEERYEQMGDVGYVTFPCGYTLNKDGDGLNLYYGAADTSIALATASIQQLLSWLDKQS